MFGLLCEELEVVDSKWEVYNTHFLYLPTHPALPHPSVSRSLAIWNLQPLAKCATATLTLQPDFGVFLGCYIGWLWLVLRGRTGQDRTGQVRTLPLMARSHEMVPHLTNNHTILARYHVVLFYCLL
eukprot:COSAG02_NODE_1022_length_15153_cov_3.631460_2_plen_126_part_00